LWSDAGAASNIIDFASAKVTSPPADIPPVLTVPVVVIAEAPLFIVPKLDVILPLSKAPVVTIDELPATAPAPISDNTSELLLPSIVLPEALSLTKSFAAAPDVKIGILLFAIPVSLVATVPKPILVLSVAP
jgi:hypothetical protein